MKLSELIDKVSKERKKGIESLSITGGKSRQIVGIIKDREVTIDGC